MSRVGSKRHIGVIQKLVKGKDAMGGLTKGWVEFTKVWCSLSPVKGTEKWYADELHATSTHKVYARYRPNIEPKMRMTIRGRTFEIVSSINIGELDKEMVLVVQEDADVDNG